MLGTVMPNVHVISDVTVVVHMQTAVKVRAQGLMGNTQGQCVPRLVHLAPSQPALRGHHSHLHQSSSPYGDRDFINWLKLTYL